MLSTIYFDNQLCRSAVKIHDKTANDPLFVNLQWSLFSLSVLAMLGHLSQRERQGGAVYYPTVPVNGLMHPAYLPAPVFLSEFGVFPNGYKYVTITAHICGEAVADGL